MDRTIDTNAHSKAEGSAQKKAWARLICSRKMDTCEITTRSNENMWSWGSRCSLLCIVARLWARMSGFRIPLGARDLALFLNAQEGSEAYPAYYSMGAGNKAAVK